MQWWPRRSEPGESTTATEVPPAQAAPPPRRHTAAEHGLRDRQSVATRRRVTRVTRPTIVINSGPAAEPRRGREVTIAPISMARVRTTLEHMDVRYLSDPDGALLAMWERHAILVALEGPDDEILMMRVRPHATVPRDWADRAYRVVNEWNHSRRFCKAYVGDPTDRDQLPIYAEVQVSLGSGLHDALLEELLECGVSVAHTFVDWLHGEGCLL